MNSSDMAVWTLNERSLDFFFANNLKDSGVIIPWLSLPIHKPEQSGHPTPQVVREPSTREFFSGERWLRESLKRIGISDVEELCGDLLESQDIIRVVHLKDAIKNELKMYDTDFREIFGRDPEPDEKEALRPLFNFYKKIRKVTLGMDMSHSQPERSLAKLCAEKERLRSKLNEYKNNFQKLKGRKLKDKDDLAPIDEDYKRYKQVKDEIARLT